MFVPVFTDLKNVCTLLNISISHISFDMHAYFHEITIIVNAHCPQVEYLSVFNKKIAAYIKSLIGITWSRRGWKLLNWHYGQNQVNL